MSLKEKSALLFTAKSTLLFFSFAIFAVLVCTSPLFAAEASGSVEAASAFWAVRDGKRFSLDVGSDVFEFDILETDGGGFGTVRFIDDTVLEMRANTRIDVKEVVFSEERARFNVGVVEGTARVITGKIVQFSPRKFQITTPRGYIGIRGTTFTVEVGKDFERLTIDEITQGRVVTYRNRFTGDVVTLTQNGDTVLSSTEHEVDTQSGLMEEQHTLEAVGAGIIIGDRDSENRDMSGEGKDVRERYNDILRSDRHRSGGGGGNGGGSGSGSGGSGNGDGGCNDSSSPTGGRN